MRVQHNKTKLVRCSPNKGARQYKAAGKVLGSAGVGMFMSGQVSKARQAWQAAARAGCTQAGRAVSGLQQAALPETQRALLQAKVQQAAARGCL